MSDDDFYHDDEDNWQPLAKPVNRVRNEAKRLRQKTIQGASEVTLRKQNELRGIIKMRMQMLLGGLERGEITAIRFRDPLCGSGENTWNGLAIDGSPCSILAGLQDCAYAGGKTGPRFRSLSHRIKLCASDIRLDATQSVEAIVAQQFGMRADLFSQNSYSGLVEVEHRTAVEAIEDDIEWLSLDPGHRLFLFLDPNGIKDLPYPQVANLLKTEAGRERVDVMVHIAGNSIKRVLGWDAAQKNMKEWIGNFRSIFIDALVTDGAGAWIRRPGKDRGWQWTMLVYFAPPYPRNAWEKSEYDRINSPQAQETIDILTNTASNRKRSA